MCVCAVGKMAKDIGMTIRKSIVVSFLPCSVAFLEFHPYTFFQCFFCYLFLLLFWGGGGGGGGGEKTMIVVVAQLQLVPTYIGDSHTVQMYNYSSKGPTTTARHYGQRLHVIGIYSIESEADTNSI